jgi:hypothetical protein
MITCPQCSAKFQLHQGIARHTIEQYEQEFDAFFKLRDAELREQLQKEAEKKAGRQFTEKINALQEQLSEKEKQFTESRAQLEKARQEARKKALEEVELEKRSLSEELTAKSNQLKATREKEMQLLKEKQKWEDEKQAMELENQRRLAAERQKIQEQAMQSADEKFRLREAEYKKKLDDFQKANEELNHKLTRTSQQLQGEVLELELEETLRAAFPIDQIEPVKKGQRGADVIQRVVGPAMQVCGAIIWEAKRAENWSDKWLQKLKDDQLAAGAEIAVIVTTTMPRDVREGFAFINGIWVTNEQLIRPLAETLRLMLIQAQNLKLAETGKNDKMALLYDYLNSPQFAQKIRSVLEAFASMKKDLDQEKTAMIKIWKKRETQINRVITGMSGMVGELQGIASNSLKQLEKIDALSLPDGEEDVVID